MTIAVAAELVLFAVLVVAAVVVVAFYLAPHVPPRRPAVDLELDRHDV